MWALRGAGWKRSPIKFDDDDAGNDFVVSDGSTALIKDYMDQPDHCQGLESMQITFKSPGSFQRVQTIGQTQDSNDNNNYQAVAQSDTSPDRFQGIRDEQFDSSPQQTRNGVPVANGHAGVNFSPSVFLRSTPRAVRSRSPMQVVDGFAVPSPSMSQSGKKKRGRPSNTASTSKSTAESVRKRAASMPVAQGPADSVGTANPSPTRRSIHSLTPEASFDLGTSAGFSDERIGILSPSDGEIELTGRESLGTVVSLRVSAGTTPSPALKSVMQSIARQSGISTQSTTAKSSAPAARSTAGATPTQMSASPSSISMGRVDQDKGPKVFKTVESDGGPSTNLDPQNIRGRASPVPDAERGALSVNLAAAKFSPKLCLPEDAQEQQTSQRKTGRHPLPSRQQQKQHEQQDETTGAAASPGSISAVSPPTSYNSSPASSPGAPSPPVEDRKPAVKRDRSLVEQLVQPITQPISQEWTKSPAVTAW